MPRKLHPDLLGFPEYCIQCGNNPEPIQAKALLRILEADPEGAVRALHPESA